jgi:hypothetical protein
MQNETPHLGKLQSVHGLSAIYTQRLIIVAGLALIFFSAMLVAFAVRQWFGYALLAAGFLVVEVFTLLGWFSHRSSEFTIFEEGFIYKDQMSRWEDIESIYTSETTGFFGKKVTSEIRKTNGESIMIPDTIQGFEEVVKMLGKRMKTVAA